MAIYSGDIFAENYTVSSSVTNVQIAASSGSTKLGDSPDDTHQFTGSLHISGSGISFVAGTGNTFFGTGAGSNNTTGDPARNQPDDTWRILLAKSNDQGATFVEKGISYQERRGLTDPFVLQLRNGSYRMYISRGASVFSAFSNDG